MNIFKKITNSFVGKLITQGIGQSYQDFVNKPDEFNTEILNCEDSNYAVNIVKELLKREIEVESHNDNGIFETVVVKLDGWNYALHIFRHYARIVMVSTRVNLNVNDSNAIMELCNIINKNDKIHQIGFIQQEGQLVLEVKRQFLFSPSIGSVESLINGLHEVREYVDVILSDKIYTDAWKHYANSDTKSIRGTVKTAEEVWFPQETENLIYPFTKKVKLIHETSSERVHEMIHLLSNGSSIRFGENAYTIGSRNLPQMTISTYKEFPLLQTMQATIRNEEFRKINKKRALELCSAWNSAVHFSLSRLVFEEAPNGDIQITLIMSGLFGEDINTRTFADYLGTMHKTIALLMGLKETK